MIICLRTFVNFSLVVSWYDHFHSENLLLTIYLESFFGAIEPCPPCWVLAEGGRQVLIICAVECLNSFDTHHLNLDIRNQAIQRALYILRVHGLEGFHQ